MAGDLTLWNPGDKPSVTLVADADGNVPERGETVEIAGQNGANTTVQLTSEVGSGVATVVQAVDYDPDETYEAGDVVGQATILVRHPVDWFYASDGAGFSAGDRAVWDAGGTVTAFDGAADHTDVDVIGPVWTVNARGNYTADKVAVVRRS